MSRFLSTLSLRRATVQNRFVQGRLRHFYPRSPCGERPTRPRPAAAPRKFLSTFSLRRATDANHCNVWLSNISIHALLAESDEPPESGTAEAGISIHALLAESDWCPDRPRHQLVISIHALLAESDIAAGGQTGGERKISIHALLAESDRFRLRLFSDLAHFYPRSPCGERQS